jgi:hypothetical protein
VLLLAGTLAVFAFSFKRHERQIPQTIPMQPAPPVSAQDSIVNRSAKMPAESAERVFCSARTRRGTPCRHRVLPGQRCAQHRGMPSMLDSANSFPSSNNGTKSRQD